MPVDPLLGQQIANFRIERLLGRGGMAVVYYGWDTALERPVALKVIDARFRTDPFYTTRFIREARTVARWQHENIVKIYHAGEEDGLYYFVMEYIAGQDLGKWLAKNRTLAMDEVLRIGRAVARALDYAHTHGVIHRDVKPANILMAEDGRVVLTDFGLAMDLAQGSVGEAFGSAHYIAPEQARRSADAVPQSDLYALGVILFEMLTGRVPFDDPSPTSVALQHLTQPLPSPRDFNPELSPETERVLLRALSKRPEDRYLTGQALMDALLHALKLTPGADAPRRITLPPPPARVAVSPAPVATPAPTASQLPGLTLDEYRLETLLGQGGMARVYRGIDTKLQRYAAIKVIDTPYRTDPEYIARFAREARAIAQLEHPNIVRLYRYGEAQGLLYMAMQFIEGADLGAVMQSYRKDDQWMPPAEILRVVKEICAALDYMHKKGVIHRDLTPSNVMLAQDGQAFVADFGLSLLTDMGTRGEIFGSPRYMAPEQAVSSAGVVAQSDLYALGIILFEMLTGRVPFESGEALEIAMQHVSTAPPALRSLRPELSPEVEAVVRKALEKNPKDRYQTGAQFATALENAFRTAEKTPVRAPSHSNEPISASLPKRVAERLAEPALPALAPQPRKRTGLRLAVSIFILALITLTGWFAFVDARIPLAFSPLFLFTASPTPTYLAGKTPFPSEMATWNALRTPPSSTPFPFTSTPTVTPASTLTPSPLPSFSPSPTPLPLLPISSTPSPFPLFSPSPTSAPLVTLRELDQMPVVFLPGNTFNMGANPDDPLAEMDERPLHPITLDSFLLDQYEVTVAQYAAFLIANGGHASACMGLTCVKTNFEALDSHLIWNGGTIYEAEPGYENTPINFITWYGGQAYCAWVGGRLPTEAEWEYAARGTDARLYPWGNELPDASHALFNVNFTALQPVDAFPDGASAFGIWGMAGSLWEWTADWYTEDFYAASPVTDPLNPGNGEFRAPRVLRGGGWDSAPEDLRASARQPAEPLNGGAFGANVGFRCAMEAGD